MILMFLFMAQIIVCAKVFTYALTNSNFTRLVVEKKSVSHHAVQNNSVKRGRIGLNLH